MVYNAKVYLMPNTKLPLERIIVHQRNTNQYIKLRFIQM